VHEDVNKSQRDESELTRPALLNPFNENAQEWDMDEEEIEKGNNDVSS
jgi:hypothetical protein